MFTIARLILFCCIIIFSCLFNNFVGAANNQNDESISIRNFIFKVFKIYIFL